MSLICKQHRKCWLLKGGGFPLNIFRFNSLFSDFRLPGLSTTHAHAERLILSLTDFLGGGGACGVMVIVIGIGHGDTSSNPRRDRLHFTLH